MSLPWLCRRCGAKFDRLWQLESHVEKGCEMADGAEPEREAIVAWLRGEHDYWLRFAERARTGGPAVAYAATRAASYSFAADMIENEAHRS